MKILACSDSLKMNTSYSLQMRVLIDSIEAEWHYIENGVARGTKELVPERNMRIYPGRSNDNSASVGETHRLSKILDPNFLFLYEDPQHLIKYTNAAPAISSPMICWHAWDADTWVNTLDILGQSADLGHRPICISKSTQNLYKERGYNVEQIYNIADEVSYHVMGKEYEKRGYNKEQEKQDWLKRLGVDPDKKILLYVGRTTVRKNIESLFQVANKLRTKRKDFVLVMHIDLHDPGASCEPKMEAVTRSLTNTVVFTSDEVINGQMQNVMFDVGVSPLILNLWYNLCDIYVSGSGGEGFGLPITEAGLCEKPFVVQDCTTGPEFSQDGKHGLLAKKSMFARKYAGVNRPIVDADDMAKQLDYLLDDEELRNKMGKSFKEWILENCSRKVIVERFKKVFNEYDYKEVMINA